MLHSFTPLRILHLPNSCPLLGEPLTVPSGSNSNVTTPREPWLHLSVAVLSGLPQYWIHTTIEAHVTAYTNNLLTGLSSVIQELLFISEC